jgi:hypothetical protein
MIIHPAGTSVLILRIEESNSGIGIEKSGIVPSLIIIHSVTSVTTAVAVFILYIVPYQCFSSPEVNYCSRFGT